MNDGDCCTEALEILEDMWNDPKFTASNRNVDRIGVLLVAKGIIDVDKEHRNNPSISKS